MGDWNFLGGILEEMHVHSTMVGKTWLTILFIFRMLVLGVAAEDVWSDEQQEFICNTEQPGCRNVCYDRAFPISLIRYWMLQVIFVSSPSLIYMGHAIYRLRALEKQRYCRKEVLRQDLEVLDKEQVELRRRVERELKQLDQAKLNKAPLRGSLLHTYVAHVVARALLEVGFMLGQHLLYGPQQEARYRCRREPCPNVVDCFISRPTEKSVFMVFMQAIAAVSLVLSLMEIMHLGYKKLKRGLLDQHPHLKENLVDYDGSKSKKSSVVQQVCTSQGGMATPPTTLSGYTLLTEKQANGPAYAALISTSSTFLHPVGGCSADVQREGDNNTPSPTEHNSNSNNTGSDTHSPLGLKAELSDHMPTHSEELASESPSKPHLPGELSTSCSAVCPCRGVQRTRRVRGPWNCSTVKEDSTSFSSAVCTAAAVPPQCLRLAGCTKSFPKPELRRCSRTHTSDSASDGSSNSQHSPTLLPNHPSSLTGSSSNRRAATNLQI
ncbi:gap junction alpha-9 protein-like [Electrophorus electricus]|uniref:gap junction alpha-9 protein-like n=1 Tax=Electrophorus electricus TaxID=8005 RepID=UPI0015CFF088|nr:gap junction alpha-9 protein-like [Electrophorus electricus]